MYKKRAARAKLLSLLLLLFCSLQIFNAFAVLVAVAI